MNFSESESYLLSLGNEVSAMKLGLENIRSLLEGLGHPENNYLKVQVAGTNGKGSVCAFLDAICVAAGVKAGVFTSPHLVSMTERIRINGTDISEAEFARHATHIRETAEHLLAEGKLAYRPTFFEQVTAIALVAFAEAGVDLAILETGLGGRLDATTAANAEIAVITRIDLDHQEYLGGTVEEIAAEKAAIIRFDSEVCVGRQATEAAVVIATRCSELGIIPSTLESAMMEFYDNAAHLKVAGFTGNELMLSLLGEHQIENAALAILVAQTLKKYFPICDEQVINGLESAKHPGRLEWLDLGDVRILFDGAHNISGACALKDYLTKYQPGAEIALVFGVMKEKDVEKIAEILFPLAKDVILTRPENSRAADPRILQPVAVDILGAESVFVIPSVADAIDLAIELSNTRPVTKRAFTCITGSLYLVGEARKILNN